MGAGAPRRTGGGVVITSTPGPLSEVDRAQCRACVFKTLTFLAVVFIGGCVSSLSLSPPLKATTRELLCKPYEVVLTDAVDTRVIPGVVTVYGGERFQQFLEVSVTLRPLGGGAAMTTVTTDVEGRFAIAPVPEGWYQLETCHEGLTSTVLPVFVSHRSQRDSIYVFLYPSRRSNGHTARA
jgi:hypothetical protein